MNRSKKLLAFMLAVFLLLSAIPTVMATEAGYWADYSELQLLIGTVNGLKSYDFTKESWTPLQEAIDIGNRCWKGKYGQQYVDDAVASIERAMDALVRMDYTGLESTLASVYSKIEEDPQLHDVWSRLDAAVAESRPLLSSGDQAAVDAAVQLLEELLAELEACEEAQEEPEVVIQEVEVEVLPKGDYCNIPVHRLWPVLFAVSAVLNVVLIVGVVYLTIKRRNTYDDTPLVSYDIDDDIEDDMDF